MYRKFCNKNNNKSSMLESKSNKFVQRVGLSFLIKGILK